MNLGPYSDCLPCPTVSRQATEDSTSSQCCNLTFGHDHVNPSFVDEIDLIVHIVSSYNLRVFLEVHFLNKSTDIFSFEARRTYLKMSSQQPDKAIVSIREEVDKSKGASVKIVGQFSAEIEMELFENIGDTYAAGPFPDVSEVFYSRRS